MTAEAITIIVISVCFILLFAAVIWLEWERRDAQERAEDAQAKLAGSIAQLEREREEKRALETTIDRAHDRLNDLVHERDKIRSK